VESPRFWKRSLKSIRCSCSELLVFEPDDGRTFAGADASILKCVVFIAFFLNPLSVTLPFAARFTCLGDSAAVREVH